MPEAQKNPIPGYELISKLGEGGMGAVYKARQVSLDRTVAIKILSPRLAKSADYAARFIREAKIAAKLNHVNIVNYSKLKRHLPVFLRRPARSKVS